MGDGPGMKSFMMKLRTLKINVKHHIVKDIKNRLVGAAGGDDNQLQHTCMLAYHLVLLTAGLSLVNTETFGKRVGSLVSSSIEAPEAIVPPREDPGPSLENESGRTMDIAHRL